MYTVRMSYDKKYDILYARCMGAGYSYGEDQDRLIVYHDMETDDITGIAIFSAGEKLGKGELDLSSLPLPLNAFNQKIQNLIFA